MTITCEQSEKSTPKRRKQTKEEKREYLRGWRERNPDYQRRWKKANPDYHQAWNDANRERWVGYHLKHKYGISFEDKERMFAEQGFACAICGDDESGSKLDWNVDHCHTSSVVRGILCHHCNLLLGHAKDNINTLASAIAYLERFRDKACLATSSAIN